MEQNLPAVGAPVEPTVRPRAYAVMAFGRVQQLVVRADVADELACKWRESDPKADLMPLYGPEALRRDCGEAGHDEGRCGNAACLRGTAMPDEWLVKVRRLVQGFEHVSGLARLWEPDYSSGSERALWARATEACADVAKLLASRA